MTQPQFFTIDGYRLAADRFYDPATHLWVAAGGDAVARCGFDPLGSETSGDVVALAFEPVGTSVARGEAFGSLEAAKFVGPLIAPISGRLRAHNQALLERPGLVRQDPLDHWLVEIEPEDLDRELALLVSGRAVGGWFRDEIARYREQGMVAE